MESVLCTEADKYESDNLILQLEITLNKLATICKKNGKLVDYINKKVRKTVTNCWNAEKDNFAKLSWAEMDDDDLDLDLELETNQLQIEGECDGTNTSKAAIHYTKIGNDTKVKLQVIEGKKGNEIKRRMSKLMFVQQKLFQRRLKLEETEKFEIEQLEKKKAEQELRMKRAEERVEKHHKLMKEKSIALSWKLAEIAHSNEMITENMKNAIIERQIKAKKQKEKIKNNKLFKKHRVKCAANKIYNRRHEIEKQQLHKNETIYFNETELKRLCGKFLYIPRIVRKSLASDLYENIENLYRATSPLLSSKTGTIAVILSDILRKWMKNINSNEIHFGNSRYNKDVLLIINRFICFDLNQLNTECAQLMIKNFIILTKNKVGAELLCVKYSQILLLFAVNQKKHEYNAMTLLCKIFQNESTQINHHCNNSSHCDQEYKRFKKQTLSLLFFNLFKSSFLTKISSIFNEPNAKIANIQDKKVIDSTLNLLCEITSILTNFSSFLNDELSQLICDQLFAIQIIPFMYALITTNHLSNVHQIKLASKCLLLLKCLTQCNKSAITKLILMHKDKFYHILSFLFQFICTNFDNNSNTRNVAHNLFDFIAVCFISNKEIQDMIDTKLIHHLCNNVPFYFILQKNGQNVLFPALISLSLNHKINLNAIHSSSLNTKHLKKYIRRNVYSDVKLLHSTAKKKFKTNSAFAAKIPAKYWSDCLHFYCDSF